MKKLVICLLLSVAACSESEPVATPSYDGRYVGTRQSNDPDLCGVDKQTGTVTARVREGHLNMVLFGPGTDLDGTVGPSGRVRASGIWRPPHAHYPQVTVLHGAISDDTLTGTASDFRCSTDLRLQKTAQPYLLPNPPRPKPRASPAKPLRRRHERLRPR